MQAQELQHLPYEMVRKYCLLVKNFTYDNYSYLIRSVVNYINQHLSSELSLATLASEFGKNASYLSSEFKKEVGDTLTTYINKHRILASLRYFNTTDMSVGGSIQRRRLHRYGLFFTPLPEICRTESSRI